MASIPKLASLSLFFTLVIHISSAKSTVTAILRDQLACTMCTSCDNPCDPIQYPPPPPSPSTQISYSPPSVPVPTVTYYPPPSPSSTSGGSGYGGGQYYPPPTGNYYSTPPPNPIVPYFPYYYYSPPVDSGVRSLPVQSIASTILVMVLLFVFC